MPALSARPKPGPEGRTHVTRGDGDDASATPAAMISASRPSAVRAVSSAARHAREAGPGPGTGTTMESGGIFSDGGASLTRGASDASIIGGTPRARSAPLAA